MTSLLELLKNFENTDRRSSHVKNKTCNVSKKATASKDSQLPVADAPTRDIPNTSTTSQKETA